MPEPFWWKPSEIPDGACVMASCVRPDCDGHRYLPRAYLIEKAGDIPLNQIQRRLRCVERPRLDRRAKPCGSGMSLAWVHTPTADSPSDQL
jgi:hypothetical protein